MPASNGRSFSRLDAKAWIVSIWAASTCRSASSSRRRSSASAGPAASLGERGADPRAQLARGLLGEGDRHDVAQRGVVAAHELDHAVDQDPRLARAGAGLQKERGVELAEQAVAHGLVGGRAAHRLLGLFARITTNGLTVLRSRRSLRANRLLTSELQGGAEVAVGAVVAAPPIVAREGEEAPLVYAVSDRTEGAGELVGLGGGVGALGGAAHEVGALDRVDREMPAVGDIMQRRRGVGHTGAPLGSFAQGMHVER